MEISLGSAAKLIKITSCYVGLFDLRSAVNQAGRWDAAWRYVESHDDGPFAIYRLNEYWISYQNSRELAAWITLFHGVFKIEAQVLPDQPEREFTLNESRAFLGGQGGERLLECPTGELVVADLTDLGSNRLEPLVSVAPGVYRVGLFVDGDGSHEFLEEIEDYPEHEGPDWRLSLQKTGGRTP